MERSRAAWRARSWRSSWRTPPPSGRPPRPIWTQWNDLPPPSPRLFWCSPSRTPPKAFPLLGEPPGGRHQRRHRRRHGRAGTRRRSAVPRRRGREDGELLTNARQAQAAERARDALLRVEDALSAGMTPDAVLTDVEEAMTARARSPGSTLREDVTARIFERFCVGKIEQTPSKKCCTSLTAFACPNVRAEAGPDIGRLRHRRSDSNAFRSAPGCRQQAD